MLLRVPAESGAWSHAVPVDGRFAKGQDAAVASKCGRGCRVVENSRRQAASRLKTLRSGENQGRKGRKEAMSFPGREEAKL